MGGSELGFLLSGVVVGAAIALTAARLVVRGEARAAKARLESLQSEAQREREMALRVETQRAQAEEALRHHAETMGNAQARAQAAEAQLQGALDERNAARRALDEATVAARAQELDLAATAARFAVAEESQAVLRESHARELSVRDAQIADLKAYIATCDEALRKAFQDASAAALNEAIKGFTEQAQTRFRDEQARAAERSELEKREIARMLEPMQKELSELEELNKRMEESRAKAEGALDEKLQRIQQTSESLASALKKPGVRGLWGEGQLKKILDSAGMTEGVHYRVQDHTEEDGDALRTDFIIMLPKGREVVIDSKAPLTHYWDAMNATTEDERARSAEAHARSVRGHFRALKSKDYWRRYPGSPDCVFLFIPYEGAYQLACEHDKELLTDCHAAKVVLANPMTLMSLVHVAAYALQEDRLKGDMEKVRDAGMSLCQRLGHVLGLLAKHRRHLVSAVDSYNEIVGSVDRRLAPAAREMQRLGISDAKLANDPAVIQASVRILPVPVEIGEEASGPPERALEDVATCLDAAAR